MLPCAAANSRPIHRSYSDTRGAGCGSTAVGLAHNFKRAQCFSFAFPLNRDVILSSMLRLMQYFRARYRPGESPPVTNYRLRAPWPCTYEASILGRLLVGCPPLQQSPFECQHAEPAIDVQLLHDHARAFVAQDESFLTDVSVGSTLLQLFQVLDINVHVVSGAPLVILHEYQRRHHCIKRVTTHPKFT